MQKEKRIIRKKKAQKPRKQFFKKKRFSKPKKPPMKPEHIEVKKIAEKYGISVSMANNVYKKLLSPERAVMLHELSEYKKKYYKLSQLEEDMKLATPLVFFIHGKTFVEGKITEMSKYDFIYEDLNSGEKKPLRKLDVKFFCPISLKEKMDKLLKVDKDVEKKALEPIEKPAGRNHIKNKVLFPLMKERSVLFLTTLEGDIIRGIVGGFNQYELKIYMKGGVPVTVLRHAIYELHDKEKKTSYLKKKVVE